MPKPMKSGVLVVNRMGTRSFMPEILEDCVSDAEIYCVDNVCSTARWDSIGLIIVDLGRAAVPDAFELLSSLRRHQSFLSVPILVCAPADENISIQQYRLLESGIITLVKPFEMPDLRRYIELLLTWHCHGIAAIASALASPPDIAPRLIPKRDRTK